MKKGFMAVVAAAMLAGPLVAHGDPITLDLTGFPEGYNANPIEVDVPEAGMTVTLRNTEGEEGDTGDNARNVWTGTFAAGVANGFCFGDIVSCAFSGEMTFSQAVQDLMFNVDGWDRVGDAVTIMVYNGASLLGSIIVGGNGLIDLSSFGAITRVFFEDSSSVIEEGGYGVGYSNVRFTVAAQPVPEPGTLALLGLGLAGLGLSRRRKSA